LVERSAHPLAQVAAPGFENTHRVLEPPARSADDSHRQSDLGHCAVRRWWIEAVLPDAVRHQPADRPSRWLPGRHRRLQWHAPALLCLALAAGTVAPGKPLTVGLIASSNKPAAEAQSRALAAFVKTATGRDAAPQVFADYEALAAAVAKGEVDVALMPPLAYV